MLELLKKILTHDRCDECGWTKDKVYVYEYFTEGGWLLCEKCIKQFDEGRNND